MLLFGNSVFGFDVPFASEPGFAGAAKAALPAPTIPALVRDSWVRLALARVFFADVGVQSVFLARGAFLRPLGVRVARSLRNALIL